MELSLALLGAALAWGMGFAFGYHRGMDRGAKGWRTYE
jgi:hypothetical protein